MSRSFWWTIVVEGVPRKAVYNVEAALEDAGFPVQDGGLQRESGPDKTTILYGLGSADIGGGREVLDQARLFCEAVWIALDVYVPVRVTAASLDDPMVYTGMLTQATSVLAAARKRRAVEAYNELDRFDDYYCVQCDAPCAYQMSLCAACADEAAKTMPLACSPPI